MVAHYDIQRKRIDKRLLDKAPTVHRVRVYCETARSVGVRHGMANGVREWAVKYTAAPYLANPGLTSNSDMNSKSTTYGESTPSRNESAFCASLNIMRCCCPKSSHAMLESATSLA
jgi:hypothetical protein